MKGDAAVLSRDQCPTLDQLKSLLGDELPEGSSDPLEEHIAGCASCQKALLESAGPLDLTPLGDAIRERIGAGAKTPVRDFDEPREGFLRGIANPTQNPRGVPESAATFSSSAPLLELPGLELIDELGRGGLGIVYLAWQQSLARLVAVKVVASEWVASPEERERALRGAAAVAHLEHPNIVQVYHLAQHENWFYGILEYLEGGSLADRLMGVPMEPRAAALILRSIARAAAFVHEKGFIHRDIKPANILFKADGTPKLADFGLARAIASAGVLTRVGQSLGTPRYMAPEQALGQQKIGPAADTYSLGSTFYEMLTGRSPFHGETKFDTLYQVVHKAPVPPTKLNAAIPPALQAICLRCLEKEPGRRFASATALADELDRFVDAGSSSLTEAQGPGTWTRHPWLVGLGCALLVIAILEGVLLLHFWSSDPLAPSQEQLRQFGLKQAETESELERARQQLSQAALALAAKDLTAGDRKDARRWLQLCPAEFRNDVWKALVKQCDDGP
jgi:serine/threonine protein kinase